MKRLGIVFITAVSFLASPAASFGDKKPVSISHANRQQLAGAIGHYARSRALLLEALREFDAGLKLANPQVLVDVAQWRNDILDRAEDLEKILDPQPRASEDGVVFQGDPRLLSEAFK